MPWWAGSFLPTTLVSAGWWSWNDAGHELVALRNATLKNSKPWVVHSQESFGFALLFQVYRGVDNPTIWERWFDDAFEWIYEQGLESPSVPRHQSHILRAYVHPAFYLSAESCIEALPPSLQHGLIRSPAICRWGPTNPCTYKLYEYSLEHFNQMDYSFLISHNSIPLKSFSTMYTATRNDKRARICIWHLAFDAKHGTYLPKASLWKGLPRELMQLAVKHKDSWVPGQWSAGQGDVAAPDEWQIFSSWYRELGEGLFEWINDGRRNSSGRTTAVWAFDCWNPADCPDAVHGKRRPFHFETIGIRTVERWVDDEELWFMRKVDESTMVVNEYGDTVRSLFDYLSELIFRRRHTRVVNIRVFKDYAGRKSTHERIRWKKWIKDVIKNAPEGLLPERDIWNMFDLSNPYF